MATLGRHRPLSLPAIGLLSYVTPESGPVSGYAWFIPALLVFLAWGIQAYFMKTANAKMRARAASSST